MRNADEVEDISKEDCKSSDVGVKDITVDRHLKRRHYEFHFVTAINFSKRDALKLPKNYSVLEPMQHINLVK